jgi:cation:H+ antiporter
MLVDSLIFIGSLVLLYYGAELALDGAEKTGKKLGISPLIVGMILVGVGTSMPEFFVSHIASARGTPEIAIGTLFGSNIANVYLVLGVLALIGPISVGGKDLSNQLIFHLCLILILLPFVLWARLDWLMSVVLLIFITIYLIFTYRSMKKDQANFKEQVADGFSKIIFKSIIGLTLIYFGGEYLVSSASSICLSFGISAYVVSAIFVAFGTSFPELMTSLIAMIKKKDQDLIIGNILGSNIFNLGLILGSLGIYDIKLTQVLNMELVLLLFCSFYLLFLNKKNVAFNKWAGILFLAMYAKQVSVWASNQ